MDLRGIVIRARRGLREDLRLYVTATATLAVAFLCLSAALLGVTNLSAAAAKWGEAQRVTVYLRDGAEARDIDQLQLLIGGLPEVETVTHVTSAEARRSFVEQSELASTLGSLPDDVFPASLEVDIRGPVAPARLTEIAQRIAQLGAVEDVETYERFTNRIDTLVQASRGIAIGIALLVALCVLAVVANTIRLSVASRAEEIEVMKLCGATHEFVRGPFVVEGAFQGLAGAALGLGLLVALFFPVREYIDSTYGLLTGVRTVFLPLLVMIATVVAGAAIGAMGSALSLRRYLRI